jgi:hypothetical protein
MKGVKFGDIHSWNDLDLILEPFVIPPAIPKTNLLDIPAGDGSLDLTEALGVIRYHDRELVFNFTVNPLSKMTFDEKVMQVSNLLNGKAFNIILDRDPDWYWEGRCIVNEHLQDKMIGKIVVKAIVRPYKLRPEITTHILNFKSWDTTVTVMNNGRKAVVPEIFSYDNIPFKFTIEGQTFELTEYGIKIIPDFQLKEGANEITLHEFTGYGQNPKLYLEFREGAL